MLLFAFVVLDSVYSGLHLETAWEEHLRNDLYCVEWDTLDSALTATEK